MKFTRQSFLVFAVGTTLLCFGLISQAYWMILTAEFLGYKVIKKYLEVKGAAK